MDLSTFRKATRYKMVRTDYTIGDVFNLLDYQLDTDIVLECGVKLQRDLVWSEFQKQELIETVVKKAFLPPLTCWVNTKKGVMYIIDGKQRLEALGSFLNDGFKWRCLFFSQLPEDFKDAILTYSLVFNRVTEVMHLTDTEFVDLFESVNFRGVQQETSHIVNLRKSTK